MEWRRVDLHIHTPGSKDWQEPDATYLDILRKAESEGLDILAFTDHNTVAGYAAMKQEINDLERWEASGRLKPEEKEKLEEYRRLTSKMLVLPGIELTATFGFHVLAIFDNDTQIRTIEHVLLRLNVPFEFLDKGETEVGPTSDVLTAYRVLADAGALVIAAHANTSHGVAMFGLDLGGQTRIAYTQDPNLDALEVTDLENKRRRTTASFFNGSKPQYPRRMHCIQGSDAHRIVGNKNTLGVGERKTEVLLPEVSFDALTAVFASNDFARTRPYRRMAEPFDYVESARKEGPTIVQSFHEQMTRRGGRLHAIVRDVVAFANTNGGTVYVGVNSNPKVPIRGVEKPDEAINELRGETERLVSPPLDINVSVLKSNGKNVVRVVVPKGEDIPYVLEGSKIYLRQEAETSLAMRDEIVSLTKRMFEREEDRAPAGRATEVTEEVEEAETAPAPSEEARPEAPEQVQPENLAAEPPRTGVEIVESEERQGVVYHTMRDLRDGNEVRNVSRASARRLWRYAIALKEKKTFQDEKVNWQGDLGLWHKYFRAGHPHYDLVQRGPNGDTHIYYGVTEAGIHGPWKTIVGLEE